jgi:hypothetical protein
MSEADAPTDGDRKGEGVSARNGDVNQLPVARPFRVRPDGVMPRRVCHRELAARRGRGVPRLAMRTRLAQGARVLGNFRASGRS